MKIAEEKIKTAVASGILWIYTFRRFLSLLVRLHRPDLVASHDSVILPAYLSWIHLLVQLEKLSPQGTSMLGSCIIKLAAVDDFKSDTYRTSGGKQIFVKWQWAIKEILIFWR